MNIYSDSPQCYAGVVQKHRSHHLLDPLLFWLTETVLLSSLELRRSGHLISEACRGAGIGA